MAINDLEFLKEQFQFFLFNHMMDYYLECKIPPSADLDIFAERLTDAMLSDSSMMFHLQRYFIDNLFPSIELKTND